jgi:hypothetical protein
MTAQQQFILESFNSQTYVDNRMDIQDTPLYDTVTIAAGSPLTPLTSVLFTSVGPQSGKTLALTNMATPQKLNAPEAFAIFGFRFRYSENISLLDIYNILNGFCFEFWMGQKNYQRGPIWNYNAGGGIYGVASQGSTSILNNGMPGRSDMHRLGINVVIENQMSFYGLLNGNSYTLNANGTGITFQSMLSGLYARGVQ